MAFQDRHLPPFQVAGSCRAFLGVVLRQALAALPHQGLPFELDAWRTAVDLAAPDNHLVLPAAAVVVPGRASVVAVVGPSAAEVAVLAAVAAGWVTSSVDPFACLAVVLVVSFAGHREEVLAAVVLVDHHLPLIRVAVVAVAVDQHWPPSSAVEWAAEAYD